MNQLIIIHKIVLYLKNPKLVKLFFFLNQYRLLIQSSNSHYDQINKLYGYKTHNFKNLRSFLSMIRLKIPFPHQKYRPPYINDELYPTVLAASNGQLDIIKWLVNSPETYYDLSKYSHKAMDSAAKYGHLEIVKWIFENQTNIGMSLSSNNVRKICSYESLKWATINGHFEILKFLIENIIINYPNHSVYTFCLIDYAANNGHLEIIKWLHEYDIKKRLTEQNDNSQPNTLYLSGYTICSNHAMDYAAKKGHLEIVKWLHENRTEGCTIDAMNQAACNDHLEVIKWLHENRAEGCTTMAMDWAAMVGNLEMVKWLHENRTEGCTVEAINGASRHNNTFETIKWLLENRNEGFTSFAINNAICHGRLEILKLLCSKKVIDHFNIHAIDDAIFNGRLDIISLLYQQYPTYCRCSLNGLQSSIRLGHVEMTKFIYEKGIFLSDESRKMFERTFQISLINYQMK